MPDTQVYAGLEPDQVWRHFAALNAIPRPSGHEAAARAYVAQIAQSAGAACRTDIRGNLVVRMPAARGAEGAPAVAVQAHLDMVCEKRPEVEHDFFREPIRPRLEGEWVYATGTTLGSDNGIGAACALALLTTPNLRHGSLELVFTVEEETGLHGAANLDPALVGARMMINLDSEDPREITIGCAGGAGTVLRVPVGTEPAGREQIGFQLTVSGLKGGHSGVQIHEPLANAIKLLTAVLRNTEAAGVPLRLASIHGGNAHNAIPRDATATVALPAGAAQALAASVDHMRTVLQGEWSSHEPGIRLTLAPAPAPVATCDASSQNRLLDLLDALPHGVLRMSQVFAGKVETSSNLATVRMDGSAVEIATSTRSFVTAEIDRIQGQIAGLGRRAGAELEVRDGYPGWEPEPDSPLLRTTERVYRQVFGTEPEVQVIHAGLECGVIAARLPGMQAVSFGPRIEGAHTPEERVSIPTVTATWRLLTAVLADLAADGA